MNKPIRYLSVCSGMEAASVAWHPLGFEPVGFSEIEPFPSAILKHRFPNTPNYGDLTKYTEWPIEQGAIDLLVGGTPCQSFSVAGLRKGLTDPRGNLALTFLGLADRLKPKWIVWENVPGVLSSSGGRDFGSFLGALGQLGYGWAYRVLDAQYFGVPQRRRRVFVVACLGDWRAPAEVLSLREGLLGYIETRSKKRKGVTTDASASVGTGDKKWPADIACTLNASFGDKQGLENQHALGGGSLFVPSPICMSSGQANAAIAEDKAHTLNATHETQTVATPIVIDRVAFNQGINAQYEPHIEASETMDSLVARGPHAVGVPTPFRKSKRAQSTTDDESWVADGKANTLNNFDLGDTRTTHAVVEPMLYENHPNDSRVTGPHDVAPTVVTRFGTGGGNVPLVQQDPVTPTGKVSHPLTAAYRSSEDGCGRGTPIINQMLHVAYGTDCYNGAITGNVAATMGTSGSSVNAAGPTVMQSMAVRRLTPIECERLQGFPDNWSRIPWKGKPEEQCPDGPRYKACGNSMAVPVMRWIGERIKAVEEQSK
jgi:DNA (cytosine-5)-methyltransferase 1